MPLWHAAHPLVLASKSSVRRMLLAAAGIPVEVIPSDVDERAVEAEAAATLSPPGVATLLARAKALSIARLHPERLVLGADQVLSLGEKRFTKPADRAAAASQLRLLAGREHELHSAIAFAQNTAVLFEHVGTARLAMRACSEGFLAAYLDAAGAPAMESVGAYQLEGPGVQLFERVDGDYFTILGLPLLPALDFLRRHGCLPS
ncbi:MAG TPA: Maf family protein [Bradyrhizobium sp.]|nr:Maf family protein [Bradyrhizobium sp.]